METGALWQLLRPDAAFPIVADAALKGTAVLVLAIGLALLLRRSTAAMRHLVWSLALAALIALPAAGALLPWELAVVPPIAGLPIGGHAAAASGEVPATLDGAAALKTAATLEDALAAEPPAPARPRLETGASPEEVLAAPGSGRPVIGAPEVEAPEWPALPDLVLGLWFAGLVFFLARWLAAVSTMRGILRRSRTAEGAEWAAEIRRAAARLGLRSPPDVRISDAVPIPLAFGIRRPVVVLPEEAEAWAADRRRTVLLHELAHLRRGDLLTHALGRIACALYWPHPLAWIAARRQRAEAERACDDLVLGQGLLPSEYAAHLVDIVRAAGRTRAAAAVVPMARRSEFEGRLLAILEPGVRREALTARRGVPVVAAGALLAAALASLAPASGTATVPSLDPGAVEPAEEGGVGPEPAPPPGMRLAGETGDGGAPTDFELSRLAVAGGGVDAEAAADGFGAAGAQAATPGASRSESASTSESEVERAADLESVAVEKVEKTKESEKGGEGGQEATNRARVLGPLAAALRDDNARVRLAAAEALVQLGDPAAAGALTGALGDASPEVRAAAAEGLGDFQDPKAVEALMKALREDEDAGVRRQAARALGEIGDRRAVPALVAALRDPSAAVRETAADVLGDMEDLRAVDGLLATLADESPGVRMEAAESLAELGDPKAAEGFVRLLTDSSWEVRKTAAEALGELELRSAPPGLRRALEDAHPEVRARATHTLGHIADPATVPWLVARLKDESRDVRLEAVEALTEIGDPSAIDALIAAMRDPDAEIRAEAAEALGRGGKR